MEMYGVRIADQVIQVPLDKLKRHPMNRSRKIQDREQDRVFVADIKANGILEPLLVDGEYHVLRGNRRWGAAVKAERKTAPCRMVAGAISKEQLRKLIYRDNNLRDNYEEEDIRDIVLREYGEKAIMEFLPRGFGAKNNTRKPLSRTVEEELGISESYAKRILASLRREIQATQGKKRHPELKDEERRFAMRIAREWEAADKEEQRSLKVIQKLENGPIAKARLKKKNAEKEARALGGIDRCRRLL